MTTPANKSGIFLEYIKPEIRPQDDLFRFVNGKWLDSKEIPADRAADGHFNRLREVAQEQVRTIIEELSKVPATDGTNAQKIGDLYRSFMDEERIEALGVTPIQKDLDNALAITSVTELLSVMGELESRGSGGLFYTYISTDAHASDTNITYMGQSGLSLPDEAYYREAEYAAIRTAFLHHVEKMFDLAKISDAKAHAQRVLQLETSIASHHWDQVKDRDAELTYNKHSFAELQALAPAFDWQLWMKATQMPAEVLAHAVVAEPSYFQGISSMLAEFDAPAWSSWLTWHVLSGSASYLSRDFVNQNFSFYGNVLSGIPELRDRWKRGVGLVEGALGEAIGEIYVERHFPEAAKARMKELVANLIEAYRVDIAALDWMSQETKEKAFIKLDKFTPKIGYPDKWKDYSALTILPDDLIANLAAISKFGQDYEFAKIGAPVDRLEWHMTPQTVNAYYNPGMNEIVFPAAILQPPFFDLEADDAVNYGGIGAVIGHEIGHGFDDQGSKYDGDGNLENWWSESDRAEFEARTKNLITQYDALHPTDAPDVHVNGALTIGENIGDLGGLTIAYKAYQIALNGRPAPVMDGYTGYQRLFIGYAQTWCGKQRPEEIRRRVSSDPHSPDEFRCNQILKNLPAFYEAFGVIEGDPLWLPESERVRIW
jgi:putative endopeptidase